MACHQVDPDARATVGPVINAVVGSPAAESLGYSYSSAMRNAGLVWNEPTLTLFLRAPRRTVPGTKMTFADLSKDQDIADVIAYLRTFDAR